MRITQRSALIIGLLCIWQVAPLLAQTPTPTQPPATTVYVSDTSFGGILKFDAAGQMTIFASGIGDARGLAFDNAGNLYVASGEYLIAKYDPSGNGTEFSWGDLLYHPDGLAFDSNGVLYVANYGSNIVKIDSTGHQSLFVGFCCSSFSPG